MPEAKARDYSINDTYGQADPLEDEAFNLLAENHKKSENVAKSPKTVKYAKRVEFLYYGCDPFSRPRGPFYNPSKQILLGCGYPEPSETNFPNKPTLNKKP